MLWLFITLFFTSLPAAIVHQFVRIRGGRSSPPAGRPRRAERNGTRGETPAQRCEHCGGRIAHGQGRNAHGVRTCPNCGMVMDEQHLA